MQDFQTASWSYDHVTDIKKNLQMSQRILRLKPIKSYRRSMGSEITISLTLLPALWGYSCLRQNLFRF